MYTQDTLPSIRAGMTALQAKLLDWPR